MKTEKDGRTAVDMLVRGGVIAALYAALTAVLQPLAFGALQFRPSEALTMLPLLFPEAIPGLTVGCVLANLLSPNNAVMDVLFGGLATLLAAVWTRRCRSLYLAPLPPVICNAVFVGVVLTVSAGASGSAFLPAFFLNAAGIAVSEAVVCYALGIPLMLLLRRLDRRWDHR